MMVVKMSRGFPTKGDVRQSKPTYGGGFWGNAKSIESSALYDDEGSASRYLYSKSKQERS